MGLQLTIFGKTQFEKKGGFYDKLSQMLTSPSILLKIQIWEGGGVVCVFLVQCIDLCASEPKRPSGKLGYDKMLDTEKAGGRPINLPRSWDEDNSPSGQAEVLMCLCLFPLLQEESWQREF